MNKENIVVRSIKDTLNIIVLSIPIIALTLSIYLQKYDGVDTLDIILISAFLINFAIMFFYFDGYKLKKSVTQTIIKILAILGITITSLTASIGLSFNGKFLILTETLIAILVLANISLLIIKLKCNTDNKIIIKLKKLLLFGNYLLSAIGCVITTFFTLLMPQLLAAQKLGIQPKWTPILGMIGFIPGSIISAICFYTIMKKLKS